MANDNATSMILKGVSSGVTMALSGNSGTFQTTTSVAAATGFDISSEETGDGVGYNVVSVTQSQDSDTPPSLVIAIEYDQTVGFKEVDMEVRYAAIPDETSLEVVSSQSDFQVSKRPISGGSNVGLSGKKLGAFTADMQIRLWIPEPEGLSSSSTLTLSMSKIVEGTGGPVKKVLLEKIVLNLFGGNS